MTDADCNVSSHAHQSPHDGVASQPGRNLSNFLFPKRVDGSDQRVVQEKNTVIRYIFTLKVDLLY